MTMQQYMENVFPTAHGHGPALTWIMLPPMRSFMTSITISTTFGRSSKLSSANRRTLAQQQVGVGENAFVMLLDLWRGSKMS